MATTTATQTSSAPSMRNPKDSMKSTWRSQPKSQWSIYQRMYDDLMLHPTNMDMDIPVHPKTDKVPHMPDWNLHLWVLTHAVIPLILHQAYTAITGHDLGAIPIFLMYLLFFKGSAIHQIQQMRRLGHIYGFLDGDKHERDQIPDVGVAKVFWSLFWTPTIRLIAMIFLTFNAKQLPSQMNWLALPLEIGLYPICLDFFFYWYHRVMHDNDFLWKYHRTHHLTKHPNALLTLYADEEQEIFDIIGIPLMAYAAMKLMGFPMGFYEWWICQQYVVFTELAGHSGVRVDATPPSTLTWLLRMFNCELAIEDHDLHHRQGWRKSHNYGKQTRVWDRIFGTCAERIELRKDNIDYENTASMFRGILSSWRT